MKLCHKRTAAVGVKSHENFVSHFFVLYVYVEFLGSNMNVSITVTSYQWQGSCFHIIFCMKLGQWGSWKNVRSLINMLKYLNHILNVCLQHRTTFSLGPR